MHYEGDIIRPPSEAGSIILQATVGCSHNRCTFCGAYRDKRFRVKDRRFILEDLDFAAGHFRRQSTLFLADGNALAIPQGELIDLLSLIRARLPRVRRVSLYANARDILGRSPSDMEELHRLGLQRVYMGLESGHDPTLKTIGKGADAAEMIRAGRQVREAGMFLSVTVLLGIAGIQHSIDHARATARVLNRMRPSQIAVLTLMLLDNTPLAGLHARGRFRLPDRPGLFRELRALIAGLEVERTLFQANHASNYFALDGRLPRHKSVFISTIDRALAGKVNVKTESMRAL
ncbi:MAG TPA: radical SAM protein [Desulfobacteraceae bacterium]|nr:radical SAM protein [Desulfobacteraceae bacterium]